MLSTLGKAISKSNVAPTPQTNCDPNTDTSNDAVINDYKKKDKAKMKHKSEYAYEINDSQLEI